MRLQKIGVLFLMLLACDCALAAAGKVLFVSGPVSIERGSTRALNKGDPVEVGDVIVTGDKARAQILMADGAKLALRSGTRFRVDQFVLPAAVNAPTQASVVNAEGKSVASLLKGGFRTATGSIGTTDRSAYEMRTPIGTLGIRGTDYVAVFCTGNCADAPGVTPGEPIRDGLYLLVHSGGIEFRGGERGIVVNMGEVVFVPLSGGRPEPLQQVPAFLEQDAAGELIVGSAPGGSKGQAATAQSADLKNEDRRTPPEASESEQASRQEAPTQDVTASRADGTPVDLTPGENPRERRDVSFSILQLDQGGAGSFVVENPPTGYDLDAQGNLTQFTGVLQLDPPEPATFDIGTSAVVESAADAATGLRWGRWSGGAIGVTGLVSGTSFMQDLSQQSLHFVESSDAAIPPVIPTTGRATYTLIGSTSPTDTLGHVGTLGAATLDADFTNQVVTSTLNLTVDGLNWVMSGGGNIGAQVGLAPHEFNGFYDTGIINPIQGAPTGSFSGFFVEPGGTQAGVPGGAALSYTLQEFTRGLSVTGVAVFRGP